MVRSLIVPRGPQNKLAQFQAFQIVTDYRLFNLDTVQAEFETHLTRSGGRAVRPKNI